MSDCNIKLGNPAPLGLFAFGLTTGMLMYVDAGWVEKEFEQFVAGYALFYGGVCQILVAIFEILKGSSFSFAVFGSYGAFWLGWGIIVFESHRDGISTFVSSSEYPDGRASWLASFGLMTLVFFIITLRKNMCLIVTFGFLVITFFSLALAAAIEDPTIKKIGGYFGFCTALSAFYTGSAELINEEYGRSLLPGLSPIIVPSRFIITNDSIAKLMSYNSKTNTLFMSFRSLQIKTLDDIKVIKDVVENTIKSLKVIDDKVHVIVDYENVYIATDIFEQYWNMVEKLQNEYYLSASRFHVSSFGTGQRNIHLIESGYQTATSA